jgi:hypothetical protein
MRKIWSILVYHYRHEFSWPLTLVMLGFLATTTWLNYTYDFDNTVLDDPDASRPVRHLRHVLTYGVAFLVGCSLVAVFTRERRWLRSARFWAVLVGIMGLYSVYGMFGTYLRPLVNEFATFETYYFWQRCLHNLLRGSVLWVPLLLYWLLADRSSDRNFYGFRSRGVTLWPYLLMLALVVPLVVWASYQPSFLRTYPRFTPGEELAYYQLPAWASQLVFELCYGVDFVFTEFFFRGFLVLGMVRFLGPQVLWPMVAFYCFIHYGKPPGETIGSVFGGYILGVISLHTRSILGGIVIHLGVAWLMELTAWWQKH